MPLFNLLTIYLYVKLIFIFSTLDVVIGLEQTRYTVIEDETVVEVCAIVREGELQREAIVTLETSDISATGLPLQM